MNPMLLGIAPSRRIGDSAVRESSE